MASAASHTAFESAGNAAPWANQAPAPNGVRRKSNRWPNRFRNRIEHLQCLGDDLGADAVAFEDGD